jgi:hypothetical protein
LCCLGWRLCCRVPEYELDRATEGDVLSGVADSSLDGLSQSSFVTTGNVHFGSVALEGLGDDEAKARATFAKSRQFTPIISLESAKRTSSDNCY